jgi:hypothetical protein
VQLESGSLSSGEEGVIADAIRKMRDLQNSGAGIMAVTQAYRAACTDLDAARKQSERFAESELDLVKAKWLSYGISGVNDDYTKEIKDRLNADLMKIWFDYSSGKLTYLQCINEQAKVYTAALDELGRIEAFISDMYREMNRPSTFSIWAEKNKDRLNQMGLIVSVAGIVYIPFAAIGPAIGSVAYLAEVIAAYYGIPSLIAGEIAAGVGISVSGSQTLIRLNDLIEALSNHNLLRDGLFQGNADTYRDVVSLVNLLTAGYGSLGAYDIRPKGIIDSGLDYKIVREQSAEEVNYSLSTLNPPVKPGTTAYVIELENGSQIGDFVRVYDKATSQQAGGWIMREEDIIGLTPQQIKEKFALPAIPKFVTDVIFTPGTRIRMSIANENFGSMGEGVQFDLLGQYIGEFVNERLLP